MTPKSIITDFIVTNGVSVVGNPRMSAPDLRDASYLPDANPQNSEKLITCDEGKTLFLLLGHGEIRFAINDEMKHLTPLVETYCS